MEPEITEAAPVKEAPKPAAPKPRTVPAAPKLRAVKVLRNIQPTGEYEIVGYHKPAVIRKDASGAKVQISAAEFVKGEMAPPPYPGVGFKDKIWVGTVVKLNDAEARRFKEAGAVDLEFD